MVRRLRDLQKLIQTRLDLLDEISVEGTSKYIYLEDTKPYDYINFFKYFASCYTRSEFQC